MATVCAAGCTSNVTPSAVPSPTRSATFVPKNISGYRNYTNSSAGITIQYPPSWQLTEGGVNATAFFNVSGVDMSFTVVAPENVGQGVTLDGFSQDLISAIQQNANLTNFAYSSSNTTLAGYPAQKLVFTYVNEGTPTQGMIELTLVNNTGYVLSYVATQDVYSTYVGIAQNMMQSFNITS
jgi:hypothetical protein